ncbi:MAG: OmpH family outer membrane protein [Lentisphaeria bacterium]|nr:OmpH family outer membrane protein [Lentisphaeria bacterium]
MRLMMFCPKVIISAAVFLIGGSVVLSAAPLKVATVDLTRLFREYYRTKIIEQDFNEQSKVYRNYIARQAEALRKSEAEYRKKLDASLNVALAPAEREKRRNEVQSMENELKRRRAELEQYAAGKARALQKASGEQRLKVIEEIRSEIRRRAALDGYTLVLDKSAKSTSDAAIILYSADSLDITERVLTELNRGAEKSAANKNLKQ